jgi:hypothetical protein
MAKYNEYTVENLAKSDDVAVIEDAVTTLKTAFKGEAARHGSLMIAAAYATVAALHAEVEKKSTLADKWEKNASTITTYYRLGLAARNLDVTPDGPVWDTATINNREKVSDDTDDSDNESVGGTRQIDVKFRVALGDVVRFADQITTEQWNSKEIQDLLSKASKALRDKAAFEKKNAPAEEKATA